MKLKYGELTYELALKALIDRQAMYTVIFLKFQCVAHSKHTKTQLLSESIQE